jgi:hypothetical protein
MLIESAGPIASFLVHPYRLTPTRTIVTGVQPRRRLVDELDGRPAVHRYLDLSGHGMAELDGEPAEVLGRLGVHLGWLVGGHVVLRPVLGRRGTSLLVGGAVEHGAVLRIMHREDDPASVVVAGIRRAISTLPTACEGVWGSLCSAYLGEPEVERLTASLPMLGAATVGQLYGPIHTSHAISGLVWGRSG